LRSASSRTSTYHCTFAAGRRANPIHCTTEIAPNRLKSCHRIPGVSTGADYTRNTVLRTVAFSQQYPVYTATSQLLTVAIAKLPAISFPCMFAESRLVVRGAPAKFTGKCLYSATRFLTVGCIIQGRNPVYLSTSVHNNVALHVSDLRCAQ